MVPSTHIGRRFLIAAALVAAVLVIAGCGGSSPVKTGSSTVKTVSLVRAAYVSSKATGYKMNMTETVTVAGHKIDVNASGSFTPSAHEGSMRTQMEVPSASGSSPQTLQMRLVLASDTIYMQLPASIASRVPGGKSWISVNLPQLASAKKLPGFGSLLSYSSTLNDPGQYLDFLRATAAGSVKNLGQQTINGVQTTHYQAEIDFSKLPNAVPTADRQATEQLVASLEKRANVSDMPVDVWIDQSDLIRRLKTTEDETVAGKSVSVVLDEDFSDYGSQPAPTVPDASQTTNLLSLVHG
jgi:hypothetical protein